MKHTYDEICKCLNIFSGSIYIKQTTALFFVSFFNEGLSNIRCNSWNLQLLISRCSNVILSVGGETPAFQRILFMLLQTLAVKGYLNMWWIEIFKENVRIWFIRISDMGQWSISQNRLDRAENMSLLIISNGYIY